MSIRRLAALLTSAFMLHLNVVAADAACVTHAGAAAAVGASHHGSGGHGSAGAGHAGDDHVGELCQTPSQSHCCEAMAACAPVDVGSAVYLAPAHSAHDSSVDLATRVPLTRFIAPETPPPKA